ncbi:hypothetical protein GGR09_001500 [Bartonella heixiaziensis]
MSIYTVVSIVMFLAAHLYLFYNIYCLFKERREITKKINEINEIMFSTNKTLEKLIKSKRD